MTRTCAGCGEPFSNYKPPVEAVELRELDAGRVLPQLRITAWGTLCADCAEKKSTTRRASR